jgi:hypothetical protein
LKVVIFVQLGFKQADQDILNILKCIIVT